MKLLPRVIPAFAGTASLAIPPNRITLSFARAPGLPMMARQARPAVRRRGVRRCDFETYRENGAARRRGFLPRTDLIRLPGEQFVGRRALCLIRARRQGQARSTARALTRASLDACARLRLSASMIFVERAGLAAGFARQRSWKHKRRIGASRSPRSGRSAAQQPRSGLTATVRCGRLRNEAYVAAAAGLPGSGRGFSRAIHSEAVSLTLRRRSRTARSGNGSARPSISSRERLRRRRRCTSKGEKRRPRDADRPAPQEGFEPPTPSLRI